MEKAHYLTEPSQRRNSIWRERTSQVYSRRNQLFEKISVDRTKLQPNFLDADYYENKRMKPGIAFYQVLKMLYRDDS